MHGGGMMQRTVAARVQAALANRAAVQVCCGPYPGFRFAAPGAIDGRTALRFGGGREGLRFL